MTYIPTKPDSGPSPLLDASTIQGDFSIWGTVFANNHVGMNMKNQGDHTNVIFTNQASGPPITQDLAVLFAKDATSAGPVTKPQLFVKVPKFLPTTQDPEAPSIINPSAMQLTCNTVNTVGPQYQSFLPGGYLLYMGSISNVSTSTLVTLSPTPTKILLAIATIDKVLPAGTIPFLISTNLSTTNTAQFTIFTNATTPNTVQFWAVAQQ